MNRRGLTTLLAAAALALLPWTAQAERSLALGDFTIHYNAFNASTLTPAVANQHGIMRSRYQGVVNVAVIRAVPGTTGEPASAAVSGHATLPTGGEMPLEFREVREGTAIYYLAEFRIHDTQTLDFALEVQPEGSTETADVRFSQQFFTD
jgi:hypothetical protein